MTLVVQTPNDRPGCSIRIRSFDLSDHEDACGPWSTADHLGVVARDEVEQKLRRDPQLFLVAELDDDDDRGLVGVVMGSSDDRRGWISRLAVDPDRRDRGIGRALIEELERRFLDMGITKVNLLVLSENVGGRVFWERLGYSGFEAVVLRSKQLDAPTLDGPAC